MPQIPLPSRLLIILMLLLVPAQLSKKAAPVPVPVEVDVAGCWADGRKDVLVMVDECPPAPPPLEDMTLWLSWYDPAECYDENGRVVVNINCDSDPSTLAGSLPVTADLYGQVCACTAQWPLGEAVVHVAGIGSWLCQDRGGDIRPTYREIYHPQLGFVTMWILPIDVLADYENPPVWQFEPIHPDDWHVVIADE